VSGRGQAVGSSGANVSRLTGGSEMRRAIEGGRGGERGAE